MIYKVKKLVDAHEQQKGTSRADQEGLVEKSYG